MKNKVVLDIIKSGNIVIPLYLYRIYPKLNIGLEEFVFLMYLNNQGERIVFDTNKISKELGISVKNVMLMISNLSDSKLINVEVLKSDKNIMEEYISLEFFHQKINLILIDEINSDEEEDNDIFTTIESEFGRTLSPMEYEIVKAWIDNGFSFELIKEAVKEATFNGVSNLRYIDKILFEWNKKGIKTVSDVDKNRVKHKEEKKERVEVFEYNWLEDDE